MYGFVKIFLFYILVLLGATVNAGAKVNVLSYDSSIVLNAKGIETAAIQGTDSIIRHHPLLAHNNYMGRELPRIFADKTFDFYIVLFLVLVFGVMRFINPRYFQDMVRALKGTTTANQGLREHAGGAIFQNFLMNFFFSVSGGIYIYYIFKWNMPQRYAMYPPSLLISIFILSLVILYGSKYAVLRFSGWAFNVRVIVNHYMYNVFLVNRALSIALLPFIILLALAQPQLALPVTIVSLFLVVLLLLNRYFRSWQVLGSFFQYSKFHFFAYLCASEILPMAVLAKLLIRGMYY